MNRKRHRKTAPTQVATSIKPLLNNPSVEQQKWFNLMTAFILVAFGTYQSIIFFGHQVVPSPDWLGFVDVGKKLLSFQLPTDYKRLPLLGILQILLSKFLPGRIPELLAGWLLNAALHPFTIVLLWLVGRNLIGRGAWFFAIIAILNPYVMAMLPTPIVETMFLFFTVLTFYFIFNRSRWSYLFATITSMLRYEGAMLILSALVIDLLAHKDKKDRFKAIGYAVLSSVPLGLWALGTFVNWGSQSETYYLKDIGTASGGKIVWLEFIDLIWQGGFSGLFVPTPDMAADAATTMETLSKIFVGGSFLFGSIYGLYKRQWNILALLLFLVPYIFAHALHSVLDPRYCVPIYWIVFLICLYGLKSLWDIINSHGRIPAVIIMGLQLLLLVPIIVWLVTLLGYVGQTSPVSPHSISIPYVAMGIAVALFIVSRILYRTQYLWFDTVLCAILFLVVISNQFMLASVMKTGRQDAEFKSLADWYIANAKPNEKMVTTFSGTVAMFTGDPEDNFIHTSTLTGQNPDDFVRNCYEKGVTYVVWDSRMALDRDRRFYNSWHLDKISFLSQPRSIGPFEYITTIRENSYRYLYIFRLKPLKEIDKAGQGQEK